MAESDSKSQPTPTGTGRRNAVIAALAALGILAALGAIKIMREAPVAGEGGPAGGPAAMPPAELATRFIISAASVRPSPAPPTSSGMAIPSQPPSAIAPANSTGKRASSSAFRQ